jgi:hypothetical protein
MSYGAGKAFCEGRPVMDESGRGVLCRNGLVGNIEDIGDLNLINALA